MADYVYVMPKARARDRKLGEDANSLNGILGTYYLPKSQSLIQLALFIASLNLDRGLNSLVLPQ